jgi:hypothetical protein
MEESFQCKTKLRVLLPEGGAYGCFQVGCITEILKSGKYTIDRVYGCSIGAILAPFVATENVDLMLDLFKEIKSIDDVVVKRPYIPNLLLPLFAFFNWGAYQGIKLVDTVFHSLSYREVKHAQTKCHVVAYDLVDCKPCWFTGEDLKEGIRCSSALWLAVPPVEFKNSVFSDGGVTGMFQDQYILNDLLNDDFDGEYIYIDCKARINKKTHVPTNALDLINNFHSMALSRISILELEQFKQKLGHPFTIIRPDADILLGSLDINPERMEATLQEGVRKGREFLGQKRF